MFSTLFNGYVIDYFIPKSRQIVKHSKFMSLASYILVPLFIGIAIFELL